MYPLAFRQEIAHARASAQGGTARIDGNRVELLW
jgi:hypothetical protein